MEARIIELLKCVYHPGIETQAMASDLSKRTPPGWASCENCNYMGPRGKFESHRGEHHLVCPSCQREEYVVVSIT